MQILCVEQAFGAEQAGGSEGGGNGAEAAAREGHGGALGGRVARCGCGQPDGFWVPRRRGLGIGFKGGGSPGRVEAVDRCGAALLP